MNRFWIAAASGLLAVGCSGVSSDLLSDSGISPQNDAASGPDVASPPDASATEDATTTKDSGEQHDGATVVDAAPDVPVGPPDSKIQCGTSSCSAQNQICCWHMASSITPYECVSSQNDCAGTYDVPISCSSPANCDSQGNTGFQCCATGGQLGLGVCSNYDVATSVACKSSCDPMYDYEIGCSTQKQDCSDSTQTCIVSKCTDPGNTMCH